MRNDLNPLLIPPQRIAFAGDWHMNARWATRAIEYAAHRDAEVIIHLGDFGLTFDPKFMVGLEKALAKYRLDLLFVDGNHDDHDMLALRFLDRYGLHRMSNRVWHLPRGTRWEWDGVKFLAVGGAHSVDRQDRTPGVDWWSGEALSLDDIERSCAGGPTDVLISHDCPSGVIVPGIDDNPVPSGWPPEELRAAREHRIFLRQIVDATQPKHIWHGHYHICYTTAADLGYGPVQVTGLSFDDLDLDDNVQVVNLDDLKFQEWSS